MQLTVLSQVQTRQIKQADTSLMEIKERDKDLPKSKESTTLQTLKENQLQSQTKQIQRKERPKAEIVSNPISDNTSPFEAVKGLKEDSDKRDLYSKHYINPDGSYTAIIGAGPIHYEKNGQFLDIDHTIKSNADFNYPYANIHNIFESYFGANSHTGIKNKTAEGEVHEFLNTRMYWERNGQAINTITSNNQTIRIEGDKAYYDNIYGSISAEFTMLTGKRKLNYIIPNKEALGNLPNDADYLVFTEDVILPFGWTSTTTEKGILIKNNFGKEIYLYENPLSTDEVQKFSRESNTLFETFQIGNTLTIKTKVKTDWLLSNERVYPVKVDPTVNVAVNNSQWHTGYQNLNTRNGNTVHSNDEISVGRGDNINIIYPRYFDGFMQFFLPTLPAASYVTSANLHLRKTGGDQNNFGSVYIRQISWELPLSGNIMNTAQYFFSDDISGSIGGVNGDKVAALNDEGIEFLTLESGNTIQLALWGEGNGIFSRNVQFAGYSSGDRPYLVINYELPILLNCGDLFTDTGGTSGNYSNNENIVWTIHPDDPVNERVSVNFQYAIIEGNQYDFLYVHDGPDTSFPLLPGLSGNYDFLISYVSSHPSGALTFRFRSDNSLNYAGWEATINCVPKTDLVGDCAEGNLRNPAGIENGFGINGNSAVAADYVVPAGQTFVLEQVVLNIICTVPPDEITLNIYNNSAAGLPGTLFNTQTVEPTSAYVAGVISTNEDNFNVWRIVLDLEPVMMTGNALNNTKYWIGPKINSSDPHYWEVSSTINHESVAASNNNGTTWFDESSNKEAVYSFNGKCYNYVYWDDAITWRPNNPDGSNGTPSTINDNVIIIEGENASFNNDVAARHLTVNQDGKLDIWKNLSLAGDMENHGSITFKSNASTTGQFDEFYGRVTGNGSFTTEKFFPARRAFRFVSSPISTIDGPKPSIRDNWQEGVNNPNNSIFLNPNPGYGIHITGSQTGHNGFDSTPTGNPSLFDYNNLTQEWFNVANTDATNLEAGIPWRMMIRGDRSINVTQNASTPTNTVIRTTGKIKTGEVERNNLSSISGHLNFIGNPYQAAIDMGEVLSASDNLNPAYYYVWDPMLGGNPTVGQPGGRGAYVTVNLTNGTNSSGSQTANQFLQPGQAAFVYTLDNGPANLKIQESHKNLNGLTAGRIAFQDESFINLVLYNSQAFESGYTPSDGLLINFSDEGDNDITFKDAPKLTNLDENLSSRIGEQFFSLQDRAYPTSDEVIPLNLTQYRYNAYVFEVNTLNLPESTTAFLVDKYLNKTTELSADQITLYSFEVNNDDELSIATDRFELVFKVEEVNLNLIELTHQEIRLYPNPTMTHSFYIEADSYKNKKLDVFISNMLGQTILHKSFLVPTTGRVEVILPNATTKGIYNVNVTSENKKLISKKLIKN